jgi:hypothetical protein
MRSVPRSRHARQDLMCEPMEAIVTVPHLRKVGVIVSEPGSVEIFPPRFSIPLDGDDPMEHTISNAARSLEVLHSRLACLERVRQIACSWAQPSKSYVAPESELDALSIEESLLLIDHMVPVAMAQAGKLRELAPAD